MAAKLARVATFMADLAIEVMKQRAETVTRVAHATPRSPIPTQRPLSAVETNTDPACSTCHGNGSVYRTCSACGGKGFHYTGVNYAGTASFMSQCGCAGGQVRTPCPRCGGAGR
jgi:hypothetical protein